MLFFPHDEFFGCSRILQQVPPLPDPSEERGLCPAATALLGDVPSQGFLLGPDQHGQIHTLIPTLPARGAPGRGRHRPPPRQTRATNNH